MKINVEIMPDGAYQIQVRADDSEAFRWAIERLKECVHASYRQWQPSAKSWRITVDGQLYIMDWLAECREEFSAEVTWAKSKKESRREWAAPKPDVDPFATLYLLPSAPREVVKAAYKALAIIHHPDKGGSVEEMQRVNAAYETITRRLAA